MESDDLESMSSDDLWQLYEAVGARLTRIIGAEKTKLERRLRQIESAGNVVRLRTPRRAYPKVLPKYQNPKNPSETWSGRGKRPRWLAAQLQAGKTLERFLIARGVPRKRRRNG